MSLIKSLDDILSGNDAPRAEFAYVDESGNTGRLAAGGTRTYSLGCVLVPLDNWTDRLDILVEARKEIRRTYKVRMRDELKANYLTRGRGTLKELQLGDGQLRDIYQRLLVATNVASSGVFAIVIDKEHPKFSGDPADRAWEYLFQRLRIRAQSKGHPIVLVHDDGDAGRVRKLHRRFRRHSWAPGMRAVSAPELVEDPVTRNSQLSYFIQSSDLVAYAAFRRIQPPSPKTASVCNEKMWDVMHGRWLREVNTRREDGIVVWPT